MTTLELDRLAYRRAELPNNTGYADSLYYLMMRALYTQARQADMPPEQGRREKNKIEETVRRYYSDLRLVDHVASISINTSGSRAAYRKARAAGDDAAALAAADHFMEILDNMPVE